MDAAVADPLRQAGIAAVALVHPATGGDASPLLTLKSWMDTMAQVLRTKSPAQEIIAYGESVEKEIKARIAANPLPEQKKILFISNYTDSVLAAMGKKSFGQYWASLVGGINLGGTAAKGALNMEQVYNWQPDQIFLLTFSDKTPDDLYNNTAAPGHDWSGINAVKNRQVFKFPFGMHRWCPPTTDTPLAMWWVAKNARPDLFGDIDMNQKIKEYYKRFYNITSARSNKTAIFLVGRHRLSEALRFRTTASILYYRDETFLGLFSSARRVYLPYFLSIAERVSTRSV